MFRRSSILSILIAGLFLAVQPAFAQNEGMEGGTTGEMEVDGDEKTPTDREEALNRVPTYEEDDTQYVELDTPPQDAFLQLAEDYIFLSEIGGRSRGRVPIWPRGEFKLGPILVFPYVEGRVNWTNNVFKEENDRSSWYVTEGAGFAGSWQFMEGKGAITFGADYRHFDYLNRDLSYSEWVGGVGVSYQFPQGLWAQGGVKVERLVDPVAIEFSGKLKRDQWYPYFDFGWNNAFGHKIDVEVGIDYLNADFQEDGFDTSEREEWIAHLTVSYPFMRDQTKIFVRYEYLWSDRDHERVNDLEGGHQLTGGIDGVLPFTESEKLVGIIQVGYRRDAYDSGTYVDGSDTIEKDNDENRGSLMLEGAIRYLPTERSSADLRIIRTLQFSSSSNYQMLTRLDLGYTQNIQRKVVMRGAMFFEHADPSDARTFTRYGAGFGGRYLWMENADLDMSLDWSKRNSSNPGSDYDEFLASMGVTIYFR